MKIEAKKNYTLRPRVVLPDSYVKGKPKKLLMKEVDPEKWNQSTRETISVRQKL